MKPSYRLLNPLKSFADRVWYAPLIAFLAGADQFILIVPIEWVMIPGVLVRPRRWLTTALWVTTGCAIGALALAAVCDVYGQGFIEHFMPSLLASKQWSRSLHWLNKSGAWALLLIALSPLPQQPAVAVAGLSHIPLPHIFAAVWSGRAIKYCSISWIASHAPAFFKKLPGAGKLSQKMEKNEK